MSLWDGRGAAKRWWRSLTPNVRGMMWMLLASVTAPTMAAFIKYVANELPVIEVAFLRLVLTLVPLAPWLVRARTSAFVTTRLRLHVFRCGLSTVGLLCYVFALSRLTLAAITAITFTKPLWVIVIAAIVLHEFVGMRRGLATLIGFAGVLIIVRPGEGLDPAMLAALGDTTIASISLIIVKRLGTTEPAERIVLYYAAVGGLLTLVPALAVWQTPTPWQLLWLLAAAFAAALNQYAMARACAISEATAVAPVEYLKLPVAGLIGFAVFAEVPSAWTLAGTAVILVSTLYIAYRERRLRGRHAVAATTDAARLGSEH
ncbi:MAG: DMT family transporter [Proteobacteria bacterium]|nr:DMT family transporter [Pseudomonadota bacterium]